MRTSTLAALSFLWAFQSAVALRADSTYSIVELAIGNRKTAARSLNAFGAVAGYTQNANQQTVALWDRYGASLPAATLGGYDHALSGVNDHGQLVGTDDGRAFTGFIGGTGVNLHDLIPGSPHRSHAVGINNSGAIALNTSTSGGIGSPFLYDGASVIPLALPAGSTKANTAAINGRSQVVGEADIAGSGVSRAILWDAGQVVDLGPLPGLKYAAATGINDDGDVAGFSYSVGGQEHAVLWANGQATDLGDMPGGFTSYRARGINDDRLIVGTAYFSNGDRRAFLWQDNVMNDLNSLIPANSGWVLKEGIAINDRGWIVGNGTSPSGRASGFLLIPEPVSSIGVLSGACVFARRSRAR